MYDPFVRGASPVGVRTVELRGAAGEMLTTKVWYPATARYRGHDSGRSDRRVDAQLRGDGAARAWLAGDLAATFAERGIELEAA